MTTTAADCMVESLLEWGVDIVFGLLGDGINGIIEALRQRQDRIRFLQVRHEETAAFMACGYAKLTGRLGVCRHRSSDRDGARAPSTSLTMRRISRSGWCAGTRFSRST
jgi:glyoxylate carboligase